MNIVEIKYGRKFNTGDYTSETIEVTSSLEKSDDPSQVLKELISFVESRGATQSAPVAVVQAVEPQAPVVEAPVVTAPTEEPSFQAEVQAEVEKVKAKKKPRKPKKTYAVYDRSIETHKNIFRETLDKNYPNWTKTLAPKAKAASLALEGKEFLDEEGIVIPEFLEALKVEMSN